jgi:hypothetical protein
MVPFGRAAAMDAGKGPGINCKADRLVRQPTAAFAGARNNGVTRAPTPIMREGAISLEET